MEFSQRLRLVQERVNKITYTVREIYLITPEGMRICEREVLTMRKKSGPEIPVIRVESCQVDPIPSSFPKTINHPPGITLPRGFNQKEVADATQTH